MEYDEKSIKDLDTYCCKLYNDNTRELNIIHEFELDYRAQPPIWWYTRECFIYQMLNRALHTLEGDTIINMGFFIRNLHQQIEQVYHKQVIDYGGESFVVYRGQGLLTTDFEKLVKTKGGLMSFNNFLSTSKNSDVSLRFAKNALKKTDMVGILFKMSINPSVSSTPFASIQELSYFQKEEEILFSRHTVFRVGEFTKIDRDNSPYYVNVTLTVDDDQELRILTEHIRKEVVDGVGWRRLGALLLKLNQFHKADELYSELLEQTSDLHEKALCYNQLGYINTRQGDYPKALIYHEKALEICKTILPPNHSDLATSYHNIGEVYHNMREYSRALSYHEKALIIHRKTLSSDHPDLATAYSCISGLYSEMGEYSKAISSHEKSLEMQQKTLPLNHVKLAGSYNNIDSVYRNMGEYSRLLSYHEQALTIRQKILPPNHPNLANSYNNIGTMYRSIGENSKALSFYDKSLEIAQKTLPPNHPHLAILYNNIATMHMNMREYSKALSFFEISLEAGQKLFFQIIQIWLVPTATSLECIIVWENTQKHSYFINALSIFRKIYQLRIILVLKILKKTLKM